MPSILFYCRSAFVSAIVLCAAGCTPEVHRYIRFPTLFSPGPAPYQRAESIQHDPYPLNDVGPEVVGGRPREYQQPINEVERARMAAPRPVGLQPIPVPAFPGTPTAVTGPPIVSGPSVVTNPPVVTTPYPTAPTTPANPFQVQPRSPY